MQHSHFQHAIPQAPNHLIDPARPTAISNTRERPIRVLFVNDHLGYPGGVVHGSTTYLGNTLPALQSEGVQPYLAILRDHHEAADRLRELGVSTRFFARSKWDPRALTDIIGIIRELDIDLLHVNGKKSHLLGRLAGLYSGTPTIIHLHFHYTPRPAWLNHLLAPRTAMALSVSRWLQQHAIEAFRIPQPLSRTVYNGIDVERFANPADDARHRIRRELGVANNQTVITVCGRLTTNPDKGQRTAIRMLARLRQRHPDTILLLVGDGPARQECSALVRELGVESSVLFTGQRQDIPDILAATDILLMPSNVEEAFGYSVAEAMCASRPVIASRKGGLVELLGEAERGFLVEGNDIDGFANTCASLIEQPALSQQPVARARAFAAELTIPNHVRKLREAYQQVLTPSASQCSERE